MRTVFDKLRRQATLKSQVKSQAMSASFHNADKHTHRRIMLVGLMFCAAFVAISHFARAQPENHSLFLKADKLVRTAGNPSSAN